MRWVDARLVGERFAEDHEASALAVDQRAAVACGGQAGAEAAGRGRERRAVQLGIAAGEEDRVGVGVAALRRRAARRS